MRYEFDRDLSRLLNTYKVDGACPDLLDRLTEVRPSLHAKGVFVSLRGFPFVTALRSMRADVTLMAAAAFFGFWLGTSSLAVSTPSISRGSASASIGGLVFSPTTWQEVML